MSVPTHLFMVYDLAHNMGKVEQHLVQGKKTPVCVPSQGRNRAFGPGIHGVPEKFKLFGTASIDPWQHGDGIMGDDRLQGKYGKIIRFMQPWRREGDEPKFSKKSLRGESIRRVNLTSGEFQ